MRPHAYVPYLSLIRALSACAPAHLRRALPIISTRIKRLRTYTSLRSTVSALRAIILSCVVLLQLKGKVGFVCALQSTIHHSPVSALFYFTI